MLDIIPKSTGLGSFYEAFATARDAFLLLDSDRDGVIVIDNVLEKADELKKKGLNLVFDLSYFEKMKKAQVRDTHSAEFCRRRRRRRRRHRRQMPLIVQLRPQ